jgi:hypothetical protein
MEKPVHGQLRAAAAGAILGQPATLTSRTVEAQGSGGSKAPDQQERLAPADAGNET